MSDIMKQLAKKRAKKDSKPEVTQDDLYKEIDFGTDAKAVKRYADEKDAGDPEEIIDRERAREKAKYPQPKLPQADLDDHAVNETARKKYKFGKIKSMLSHFDEVDGKE